MEVTRIDEFNNSKISLNRKILSWEWYTEPNTFKLFIHCLLRANFKDEKYRGILVKRGQFITGRKKLSAETGLTERQVRTAISRLEMTNELTREKNGTYTVITVNKYNIYQQNYSYKCPTNDQQTTNERPASDQGATTNNNDNNDNNISSSSSSSSENEKINFYGEYYNIFLTEKQYKKLEVLIMDKKMMKVILDDFSVNIETGKEKQFNPDLPNAHFERLKAYYNYRRKHPNKATQAEVKKEKEVVKVATMENYKPWG